MNILAVINPEKVEERDVVDWRTRQAARTVVLDENGLVGLLHVTEKNYYKLPGRTSDYEGAFIEKRDLRFLETAMKRFAPEVYKGLTDEDTP